MLVIVEKDCDLDSEGSLSYIRAETAVETRTWCRKHANMNA
jgi:hypothetical protein